MCNAVDTRKQAKGDTGYEIQIALGTTVKQILPRDENRTCVIIGRADNGTISIGLSENLTTTTGLFIPSTYPFLILTAAEHGALVKEAVYALHGGAGGNISVWVSTQRRELPDMRGR